MAAPIATTGAQALALIDALVEEMEDRMSKAAQGLRVAQMKPIILYVDEMADLVSGLPKAQAGRVITGFQRLSQTGRGLRIGIVGATQRVYDLDASMYTKLNGRFVGKTQNANDGAAAAGVNGVSTHKLPGKGAFEFYPGGERLQGFFVADPDRDDYPDQLRRFADDIAQRWQGEGPHWQPGAGYRHRCQGSRPGNPGSAQRATGRSILRNGPNCISGRSRGLYTKSVAPAI